HAGAKLVLGQRDFVLELFVLGQRADEERDGRHVVPRRRPDRDRHRGRSFKRYTSRIAPCVSEKLAILLSTRPASSPAWMTSVSRSSLRPPLGRTTHTAPFGSIHNFTWLMRRRSVRVSADRKTRSQRPLGRPRVMSEVRSRSSFKKSGSSTPTIATLAPGLTPSLSNRERVDTNSGLTPRLPGR